MIIYKKLPLIKRTAAGRITVVSMIVSLITIVFIITAYAKTYTSSEVRSIAESIVAFEEKSAGASSVQEWLDGELTDEAGAASEWYIIALRQSGGDYYFDSYANSLQKYISANNIASASSRQKYALAMIASGRIDSQYVLNVVNGTIGEQGVLSWIFGLHMLNNGLTCDKYSASEVVSKLLSLHLPDGGWAVTGDNSDVDVTAMAVQALAPYYSDDDNVKSALDGALDFLSSKQHDDGDFSSYGVQNPESTAQVIVALSALGIDCQTEVSFIKNGNTLFDGLLKYKLDDGSFTHKTGGVYNHTATSQVYYSLIAYLRFLDGRGPLFVFDKTDTDASTGSSAPTDTVAEENTAAATAESALINNVSFKLAGYKFWALIAVGAATVIISAALWMAGRRHPKNFIFIIAVGAVIMLVIALTDFKSTAAYYSGETESKANITGSVTLTIRCDTIVGLSDSEYVPENGIILDTTCFDITESETVYDVLAEAARSYNIQMENEGSALGSNDMTYISGINYIYEFDYGDLSGWVYRVNGERPSVNCGEYTLVDGDKIEWLYTRDLGNDLKTGQ